MVHSTEQIISEIGILLSKNDRAAAIALACQVGEQGLDIPIGVWLSWLYDPFYLVNSHSLSEWGKAILSAPTTSDAISALKLLTILNDSIVTPEDLVSAVKATISSTTGHVLMGMCYYNLHRWDEAIFHFDFIDDSKEYWRPSLYYRVGCLVRLMQWDKVKELRCAYMDPNHEFDWVIMQNIFVGMFNEYNYDLTCQYIDWMKRDCPDLIGYLPNISVNRSFMEMLCSYPNVSRLLLESQQYSSELSEKVGTFPSFEKIEVTSERARIGYFWSFGGVLQDLPVLEYVDRSRYESFLYFGNNLSKMENIDSSCYENAFNCHLVKDEDVVEKILKDNLDALIVLDNVGYYSRDPVIAARPCKRIAYYGNIFYPTFMPAVDALILPERLIRPMAALGGNEVLLSIPDGLHLSGNKLFRILDPLPFPPGPPVIGSVASPFKMNRRWFERVAKILDAVPQARLRLDLAVLVDQEILRILELAKDAGIDFHRIDIHRAIINNYFRDRMAPLWLAIDTAPFSCYYTALQALSAGLPILTVPETLPASHLSASILEAIGADLLVCRSEQALIDKAIMLLTHPEALANVRSMVAEDVRASLLADLPASAKIWEQTLDRVLELPVRTL